MYIFICLTGISLSPMPLCSPNARPLHHHKSKVFIWSSLKWTPIESIPGITGAWSFKLNCDHTLINMLVVFWMLDLEVQALELLPIWSLPTKWFYTGAQALQFPGSSEKPRNKVAWWGKGLEEQEEPSPARKGLALLSSSCRFWILKWTYSFQDHLSWDFHMQSPDFQNGLWTQWDVLAGSIHLGASLPPKPRPWKQGPF